LPKTLPNIDRFVYFFSPTLSSECLTEWTALTSIQLKINLGHNSATSPQDKVQDVNDLMQRLIDVWAGVELGRDRYSRLTSQDILNIHHDIY